MTMHRPFMRHALFGLINFALTAPGIYLWIGLPLVMRQRDIAGGLVGRGSGRVIGGDAQHGMIRFRNSLWGSDF